MYSGREDNLGTGGGRPLKALKETRFSETLLEEKDQGKSCCGSFH